MILLIIIIIINTPILSFSFTYNTGDILSFKNIQFLFLLIFILKIDVNNLDLEIVVFFEILQLILKFYHNILLFDIGNI